jgi:hypothetical protein
VRAVVTGAVEDFDEPHAAPSTATDTTTGTNVRRVVNLISALPLIRIPQIV